MTKICKTIYIVVKLDLSACPLKAYCDRNKAKEYIEELLENQKKQNKLYDLYCHSSGEDRLALEQNETIECPLELNEDHYTIIELYLDPQIKHLPIDDSNCLEMDEHLEIMRKKKSGYFYGKTD